MFRPQAFSFENMDREGNALCLGETVILQEEINPLISRLREFGIIVTALHNHWLFDKPRLMFIHFESIDRPLSFSAKVREALDVLTTRNVGVQSQVDHPVSNRQTEEEFNPLISKLRQHDIIVTAFHNHWLFDHPRLMYIHFEKIDNPIQFAKDVKDSLRVLTTKEVRP
ncbi:DUF1259 domain-containing protein [Bacillus sp. EB600]|nr:DUF1259 domain-containing protein [Bacillus sp. EB600]